MSPTLHFRRRFAQRVGRVLPAGAEYDGEVVAFDARRGGEGAGGFVLVHAA